MREKDKIDQMVSLITWRRFAQAMEMPEMREAVTNLRKVWKEAEQKIDEIQRSGEWTRDYEDALRVAHVRVVDANKKWVGLGMSLVLQDRRSAAKLKRDCQRMLRRSQDEMSRFVWYIHRSFGPPEPGTPHIVEGSGGPERDIMTDFEGWSADYAYKSAWDREVYIDRMIALKTLKRFQKRMKELNIPVLLQCSETLVFWSYGGGSVSSVEFEWLTEILADCAVACHGRLAPHEVADGVGVGVIYRDGTDAELRAAFPMHYY